MLKYILLLALGFFIFGCSENGVNNSSNSEFMSVSRASAIKGVNITQVLDIEFSSEIDLSSLTNPLQNTASAGLALIGIDNKLFPIYLKDSKGNVVPVNISQDDTNPNKLIVTPWKYLLADTTYTLVATTALKDVYGRSLIENYELSFTPVSDRSNTGNTGSFNVLDSNPNLNTQSGIEVESDISFAFDGRVAYSDIKSPWFRVTDLNNSVTPLVVGTYEYINYRVVFTPTVPFILGHTYDVNFTANSKTDMYGNELNISSAPDRNFTVDTLTPASGYAISTQGAIDIGHVGTMVRYFTNAYDDSNTSTRVQYAAVARSGGVDFYAIYINTSTALASTLTKKSSLTLNVNSTVTDMQYVDSNNSQKLLISTLKDGVFMVSTTNNSTLDVTRLLKGEADIYGVGYAKDSNNLLNAIYAVGPTMGLKTFLVDTNGNISSDKNISITGEALKVTNGSDGTNNYIFVADYKNGVQVYNSDGTFNTTITISGNVKYVGYIPDANSPLVVAINSVGNIYGIDTTSLTSSAYLLLSTYTSAQDASVMGNYISVGSANKGNALVYSSAGSASMNAAFASGINENIVSSFRQSFDDSNAGIYIDFDIVLSKEGKLIAYFNGGGAK